MRSGYRWQEIIYLNEPFTQLGVENIIDTLCVPVDLLPLPSHPKYQLVNKAPLFCVYHLPKK